jgi:uncharacterized protein YcbK (DUF882 family)
MMRKLALTFCFLLAACGSSGSGHRDLIGTGMAKTRPDPLYRREIVLRYPYTGEKIDVVYYHDQHYDPRALRAIDKLFRDRHENVAGRIDPELIDFLVDIRTRLNLPTNVTFDILSGYRTAATNHTLAKRNGNVATESLHMHGWAVDFRIGGVNGCAIAAIAKTMQRGAAVCYRRDNHVHVDLGNIRQWREK